ncbi:MAG TPA: GNAT family protein [Terriglobia bacterium]|nr:GNAT family protein [Terriglobia bacterium]
MILSHSFAEGAELRLLEHRHADELFALIDHNRSYLRQWLPEWDVQKSLDDCKRTIKSSLEQLAANGGFTLGIWWEGRLAGILGAANIDWENRSAMVGYLLGESYQGKGLMTGACRAVVDYLFSELKLHRVEIRCATNNPRSCAVPKRLGFSKEGVLRQAQAFDDRFLDLEVYGLLAEDWNRVTE